MPQDQPWLCAGADPDRLGPDRQFVGNSKPDHYQVRPLPIRRSGRRESHKFKSPK
jgi:hypothetical protein